MKAGPGVTPEKQIPTQLEAKMVRRGPSSKGLPAMCGPLGHRPGPGGSSRQESAVGLLHLGQVAGKMFSESRGERSHGDTNGTPHRHPETTWENGVTALITQRQPNGAKAQGSSTFSTVDPSNSGACSRAPSQEWKPQQPADAMRGGAAWGMGPTRPEGPGPNRREPL